MIRLGRSWVVAAAVSVAASVVAQEQLPKNLEGDWRITSTHGGQDSGRLYASIEKQNPDGTIEGKMTYSGNRFCEFDDGPMTGKIEGNVLTLRVMLRNKFANAGCGETIFVMNKGSGGEFNGEGNPDRIKVRLGPR